LYFRAEAARSAEKSREESEYKNKRFQASSWISKDPSMVSEKLLNELTAENGGE